MQNVIQFCKMNFVVSLFKLDYYQDIKPIRRSGTQPIRPKVSFILRLDFIVGHGVPGELRAGT